MKAIKAVNYESLFAVCIVNTEKIHKMHNLKPLNCIFFFTYFVLGRDVNMYYSLPCLAINLSKNILGEIYEIYTMDGSDIINDSNIQVYYYY